MAANLTQIFNFKVNFHQEFKLFSKKKCNKIYSQKYEDVYVQVLIAFND